MQRLTYVRGPFVNNIYVLVAGDGRTAAVIDPGLECEDVAADIERRGLHVAMLLNTHGHVDHAAGNAAFKARFGAPLLAHPADRELRATLDQQAGWFGLAAEPSPEPDIELAHGDVLDLAGESIRVLHVPGHTPGGCCFVTAEAAYTGDTLFRESIGRTDLPGGAAAVIERSIRERLYALDQRLPVLPGHGEPTTIGHEMRFNPFVRA